MKWLANYMTLKRLSIFILKNKLVDLSDYFIEEGINQTFIQSILDSIENDELDISELVYYCLTKERNYQKDKELADICESIGINYYITEDNYENNFSIFSSDGNFRTNYESTNFKDSECTGVFKKYVDYKENYEKILDEIRNNFPEAGEYDLIVNSF